MPFSWPGFTAALTPWFTNNAEDLYGAVDGQSALGGSDGSETARVIAGEYSIAINFGQTLLGNKYLGNAAGGGWNRKAMEAGFKAGFALQAGSPTDLGIAPYSLMAAGVLASWTPPVKFLPVPPHPPGVQPNPAFAGTQTACVSVMPGSPMPLAALIMQAFKSNNASAIAPLLVTAFKTHLSTISGVYQPLIPNPAGAPPLIPGPPIPWVGVT